MIFGAFCSRMLVMARRLGPAGLGWSINLIGHITVNLFAFSSRLTLDYVFYLRQAGTAQMSSLARLRTCSNSVMRRRSPRAHICLHRLPLRRRRKLYFSLSLSLSVSGAFISSGWAPRARAPCALALFSLSRFWSRVSNMVMRRRSS